MELHRAIDQIEVIHDHLNKSEVYRGYRSLPVALTGVLAVLGGLLQPLVLGPPTGTAFVTYWVVIAAACVCLVAAEIALDYMLRLGPSSRRLTWRTLVQPTGCII